MVDFFTTWCGPCKKLDKLTWPDPAVQKWLAEKTVALKIDAEKDVPLAKRFKITAYPTILFVNADGKEIDHLLGFAEPDDFLAAAKGVLSGRTASRKRRRRSSGTRRTRWSAGGTRTRS